MITKDISIEELVQNNPDSVRYLMDKGIKCLACGEPIWGTLESASKEKGFANSEIQRFVEEINSLNEVDKL
jgi:methionine synthase II (cobalamin-independent)